MEFPKFETTKSTEIQNLAKDLFRHGYNTNNLGYFYFSMKEAEKYMLGNFNQGLPLERDEEFYQKFYELGIADEVTFDLLDEVYETKATKLFKDVIECYSYLFTGHFHCVPGVATFGDMYPEKYDSHLEKIKNVAAQLSLDNKRIFLEETYDYSKFGGFSVEAFGNSLGFDVLSLQQGIKESSEIEKIVAK